MTQLYQDTTQTRQAVIEACRALNARGINQGTAGNVSVRVDGRMLITPSGVDYDAMTPEMIVPLPLHAPPTGAEPMKPSSEWRFHQAILRARPDVQAVVHAHPVYATALAMQRKPIPACHYMVAAFGGADVPVTGYALFGSDALADMVTDALRSRHACLMSNHGATVVGETLAQALWRMTELETLAKMYLLSQQGGTPHLLSDSDIAQALEAFADYGKQ